MTTRSMLLGTHAAGLAWRAWDAHREGVGPRGGNRRRAQRLDARARRAARILTAVRAAEEGGFRALHALLAPNDGADV